MKEITRVGAYAVIEKAEQVLLCQLTRSRMWTLPGGGLEFGEEPLHALHREVHEETGLEIENPRLIGVNSNTAEREDRLHMIQIVYRANAIHEELTAELEGTTDACAWCPWDEVIEMNITPSVKFAIKELAIKQRTARSS